MTVIPPADVTAYEADVRFLRDRGCVCPLRIECLPGGVARAIPATGCNLSGDRRVCDKRLNAAAEDIGETAMALDRVLRGEK